MRRKILVIGGNSGISKSLVRDLSFDCEVIATSRTETDLEYAFQTLKFDAYSPDQFDLSSIEYLDGVVYCPGSINLKPFKSLKIDDFQQDLQVNFLGAVSVIQKSLPLLMKSTTFPSIVLFSTVAAKIGMPYHASIAASKAAIEGLSLSLSAELSPRIRVNTIAPSLTDTPLASAMINSEAKLQASKDRHPMKQIGNPDDIAEVAKWLLSERAKFITGQVIQCDGGMSSIVKF